MTERLYQRDMTLGRFPARLIECRWSAVVLDRTAFFPGSVGVPGDTGKLAVAGREIPVVETTEQAGTILHRVEGMPPDQGSEVEGRLDGSRRHRLMPYHTAMHQLTGVMFQHFGVRVTGNQITPEKARVGFAFAVFDGAIMEDGLRRANDLIAQILPVRISFVPIAESKARPEWFKLETEFPPSSCLGRQKLNGEKRTRFPVYRNPVRK